VLIFWGFLIIHRGYGETLVQGLFPSFSLALLMGLTSHPWLATDHRLVERRSCWRRSRSPWVRPARVRAPPDPDEQGRGGHPGAIAT
jgi:hypothetical protein